MPANSIKYIEVITNPGAKYDAEGVGGILNIATIDNRGVEGYTVTLSGVPEIQVLAVVCTEL